MGVIKEGVLTEAGSIIGTLTVSKHMHRKYGKLGYIFITLTIPTPSLTQGLVHVELF